MPHNRARRCSLSAALASFSIRSRSHLPSFSVIFRSQVVDGAVALFDAKLDQGVLAAGTADAPAAVRGVRRAVRRAYQIAPLEAEELALAPVELHRHVRAAVQVGMHPAFEAQRERRRRLAEVLDLE